MCTQYPSILADQASLKRKEHFVDFGNKNCYCSCSCLYFRHNRIICKHFFAIIEGNYQTFNHISKLFRDHVWINLDSKLFLSTNNKHFNNSSEKKHETSPFKTDVKKQDLEEMVAENQRSQQPQVNSNIIKTRQNSLKLSQINLRAAFKELYALSYIVQREELLKTTRIYCI